MEESIPDSQCNRCLKHADKRHPDHKIPVLCLMPEHIHPRPGSNTSTEQAAQKQMFFGNPPQLFSCPLLVHSHQKQPKHIHNQQINPQQFHFTSMHKKTRRIFFAPRFSCSFILLYSFQSVPSSRTTALLRYR